MTGESGDSHPFAPFPPHHHPLYSHHPSLCVCGCARGEKQCRPAEPGRYSRERDAWKEEGWAAFMPCGLFLTTACGKTLWGTDTPFLHPQTLYFSSHTEATQTAEEGGMRESEQRNFSDWGVIKTEGGCCKRDVGLLATAQTIQIMSFLRLNGTNTCQSRSHSNRKPNHHQMFVYISRNFKAVQMKWKKKLPTD